MLVFEILEISSKLIVIKKKKQIGVFLGQGT